MRILPLLLAGPVIALSACSSSAGSTTASSSSTTLGMLPSELPARITSAPPSAAPPQTTTTTTATRPAPTPVPGAGLVVVSDPDMGHTVALHVGARLQVVLRSTYWTIAGSSDPGVLRADGAPAYSPQPSGCVPGEGCGTVSETFITLKPGRATVTASRTTCGEALACGPTNGSYSVTVVVS